MPTPELERAILERIKRIPIVSTLKLKILRFDEGYCESWVPREVKYDGVFESFHGGLLMTIADSTASRFIGTVHKDTALQFQSFQRSALGRSTY